MKTATILAPDESCELGVVYDNNTLYAGYIHNAGVSRNWEIEYDNDSTWEENLINLSEIVYNEWTSSMNY